MSMLQKPNENIIGKNINDMHRLHKEAPTPRKIRSGKDTAAHKRILHKEDTQRKSKPDTCWKAEL